MYDAIIDKITSGPSQWEGWCPPEKAKRMERLVREADAKLAVELGVFAGRSLAALGFGMMGRQGVAHGIDPFTTVAALEGEHAKADSDWWGKIDLSTILAQARRNITSVGLDGVVKLYIERSAEAVGRYADGSIDVLHQDSNHSEQVTLDEVARWTPKMRPGGFWIADDIDWPTTRAAYTKIVDVHGYKLIENHTKWAIYQAPC